MQPQPLSPVDLRLGSRKLIRLVGSEVHYLTGAESGTIQHDLDFVRKVHRIVLPISMVDRHLPKLRMILSKIILGDKIGNLSFTVEFSKLFRREGVSQETRDDFVSLMNFMFVWSAVFRHHFYPEDTGPDFALFQNHVQKLLKIGSIKPHNLGEMHWLCQLAAYNAILIKCKIRRNLIPFMKIMDTASRTKLVALTAIWQKVPDLLSLVESDTNLLFIRFLGMVERTVNLLRIPVNFSILVENGIQVWDLHPITHKAG